MDRIHNASFKSYFHLYLVSFFKETLIKSSFSYYAPLWRRRKSHKKNASHSRFSRGEALNQCFLNL